MSKLVSALVISAGLAGSFFLGRWWKPSTPKGERPIKGKGKGKAPAKDAPAKVAPAAQDRIAELAKSDPEIARFVKANPGLVQKALKDPGSVANDPKFLLWAATHGAQVAAIQEAMRSASPVLAIPAGPAAKA